MVPGIKASSIERETLNTAKHVKLLVMVRTSGSCEGSETPSVWTPAPLDQGPGRRSRSPTVPRIQNAVRIQHIRQVVGIDRTRCSRTGTA